MLLNTGNILVKTLPLGIRFEISTSETKTGLLLIGFRKLINSQNNGHQGPILGGLSRNAGFMESFIYADIDPENLLTHLDTLSTGTICETPYDRCLRKDPSF